jgi:hypothetical protein
MAARSVTYHGRTVQYLDSGSALLDPVGNSGLSYHMLSILGRLRRGAVLIMFHFRYIAVNDWLREGPWDRSTPASSATAPASKQVQQMEICANVN